MKKARMVFVFIIIIMVLTINVLFLAACGNRYYYTKLFQHIETTGVKDGKASNIDIPMMTEDGRELTLNLYINRNFSHFIPITAIDDNNNTKLQLSIDPQLSGVYSIIPKIYIKDKEYYVMCEYNPITKEVTELDDMYCPAEYKEQCMAVIDDLLPALITNFKTYIETHSADMDNITMAKLGFEPRPIELPEANKNEGQTDNAEAVS